MDEYLNMEVTINKIKALSDPGRLRVLSLIEKSSELNRTDLIEQIKDFSSAGITAGASTPPEEIEKEKN